MAFACAVALSGRFGLDLDLEALSGEELDVVRRAVATARRTQDLVQMGELVRLVSPVEGADRSRAALAHVAPDRSRAVVFAYQLESADSAPPMLRFAGLDPDRSYVLTGTDLHAPAPADLGTHLGADLVADGLAWPCEHPLTAFIWELAPALPPA